MGLYKDVHDGEDAKALATLKSYFKLDEVGAASALAAIRGVMS